MRRADYKCIVKMPSAEFQRIMRDLAVLGDTCTISVNKEGVRFSVKGDLGVGNVLRKQSKSSEKAEEHTTIEMEEATELTFALRYLNFFTKVRGRAGGTQRAARTPVSLTPRPPTPHPPHPLARRRPPCRPRCPSTCPRTCR